MPGLIFGRILRGWRIGGASLGAVERSGYDATQGLSARFLSNMVGWILPKINPGIVPPFVLYDRSLGSLSLICQRWIGRISAPRHLRTNQSYGVERP